jgi:hypothetical protein
LLAAVLVVIFFVQILVESFAKSPTSDEPPHLASGLSYIATGIFRGNPQHPPLLKELSGLSLLLGGIRWPRNPQTEFFLHGNVPPGLQPDWEIGYKLIAENGPDRVLFWARLPFMLIASLLGILLYIWGRDLVGGLAALGAVFLYTTDPTIIGHSYLVTTDVGLAAFTVLLLFALWQYLRKPTPLRLVLCGLVLGAALCAKFSALLLLPCVAFLLFAALLWPVGPRPESDLLPRALDLRKAGRNDPCPCGSGKKYKSCHALAKPVELRSVLRNRWVQGAAAVLAMCGIAVVVIEAVYFFPKDPLALYLHGLAMVNADHKSDYPIYLDGELRQTFPAYFAIAYLVKEPIAGIILAAIGLVVLLRSKSITPLRKMFLLVPPAILFTATTLWADQIGVRYIIPVLPFAHLLGGLGLAALFTATAGWGRWVAAGLCAWLVLAAAGIYPDHLSYFNESACLAKDPGKIGLDGGSKCGYYWLDDSNVDWGQSLKQLKAWLDHNAKGRTIRLSHPFGVPANTYGIASENSQLTELSKQPIRGLYVVSAHAVARVPAFVDASDWLRRVPPVAVVGHALYVYEIR